MKNPSVPRISIVTPSYNQAQFLEETILSVLSQNYPDLEHIVIDGGSTDNSIDIIKKYEKHLTYWVSEPDRGQSHAINKGFKRSSGELLGWLNSDDYFLPGALQYIAKAYKEDRQAGAILGRGSIIDSKGNVLYSPKLHQVTLQTLYRWTDEFGFMQPSCLFTREAWENCGPLDENLHYAMDVDLWLNIAKKYSFRCLDEIISHAHHHQDAKTVSRHYKALTELIFVYIKHGGIDEARRLLERLLMERERNNIILGRIYNNPLVRLILPFKKLLLGQDIVTRLEHMDKESPSAKK